MTFSGDLREINLSDVFQNIASNRATGTLCIRYRREERYVRFAAGVISGSSIGSAVPPGFVTPVSWKAPSTARAPVTIGTWPRLPPPSSNPSS